MTTIDLSTQLTADCTVDDYKNKVSYSFSMSENGVIILSAADLTFDGSSLKIYNGDTNKLTETAYLVTVNGEIENYYGSYQST